MEKSSPYDERALLVNVAGGDPSAFTQLYMHWHQLLASYIFRITESTEVTEEIVQDVFLKIWMSRETLVEIRNFKHFLIVVARNHAFGVMKKSLGLEKSRRQWEKETMYVVPTDDDNKATVSSLIDDAIDSLPARRKEVYLLSRHERLSYEEIALKLGISKGSVKSHLKLASRSISTFIRSHLAKIMLVVTGLLKFF